MKKFKGRPILGAISGFFLFAFLAVDLVLFGVIPLNSALITIMPFVGIIVGLLLAYFAPFGGKKSAAPAPAYAAAAPAPPPAPPPPAPPSEAPPAPPGTTQF